MSPGMAFDFSPEEQRPPASQHPWVSALQPSAISSFMVNFLLKETSTPEPLRKEAARKRNSSSCTQLLSVRIFFPPPFYVSTHNLAHIKFKHHCIVSILQREIF